MNPTASGDARTIETWLYVPAPDVRAWCNVAPLGGASPFGPSNARLTSFGLYSTDRWPALVEALGNLPRRAVVYNPDSFRPEDLAAVGLSPDAWIDTRAGGTGMAGFDVGGICRAPYRRGTGVVLVARRCFLCSLLTG